MIRRTVPAFAVLLSVLMIATALAQEPAKPQEAPPRPVPQPRASVTALLFEVTISRQLNGKVISSTPYTLSVAPENKASLRMGGDVPVPSTTYTPASKEDGKPAQQLSSYTYRSIGTGIDITAVSIVDQQYRVLLTIDENSIYPADLAPSSAKTTGAPAFRSFKSTNTINLRDGQSLEYTTATDRLTGEVFHVAVKLSVVK